MLKMIELLQTGELPGKTPALLSSERRLTLPAKEPAAFPKRLRSVLWMVQPVMPGEGYFVCQLDWTGGCPGSCLNLISRCVSGKMSI